MTDDYPNKLSDSTTLKLRRTYVHFWESSSLLPNIWLAEEIPSVDKP